MPAQNERVARQFFEAVLAKGQFEHYAESYAPDFIARAIRMRLFSRTLRKI